MKKVLGLAILASLIAAPALAGETFVRNTDTSSHTFTKSNLHLNSKTLSNRNENYGSYANKVYVEGNYEQDGSRNKKKGGENKSGNFSVHTAGSGLTGSYNEYNYTSVTGTINSLTNSNTNSHETSSGVR